MSSAKKALDRLRGEIDEIDDGIHDLLMERAARVEKIRDFKGGNENFLRPAREAAVLRRLAKRHRGNFPIPALIRLWREMMAALVRMQGPFSVAVYMPEGEPGYWDLARDQFGTLTPMTAVASAGQAVFLVSEGMATVGILPWPPGGPSTGEEVPWWRQIATNEPGAPRIIARLPFAGRGNSRNTSLDAVAIARVEDEESGYDRSVLLVETEEEISRSLLKSAMNKAGFKPIFLTVESSKTSPGGTRYLMEIGHFVAVGDPRLAAVAEKAGQPKLQVFHIGTYAEPMDETLLGTSSGTAS